jgi:hypothetical protein
MMEQAHLETDSKVFVAYTSKNALYVYSLPHLEHIHVIPTLSEPLRYWLLLFLRFSIGEQSV